MIQYRNIESVPDSMFDIGFFELLLVAVLTLIVLGPERLPVAVKALVRWWMKIKENFRTLSDNFERELKIDELRQDIHNEKILESLAKKENVRIESESIPDARKKE